MGRREDGKTFLDEILAKVPDEAKRKEAAAIFAVDDVLDTLGDGYKRQQDFSRDKNELQGLRTALDKEREQLEAWRQNNVPVIEEYLQRKEDYEAWKAAGGRPGDRDEPPKPVELPADVMKKLAKFDELEKKVVELNLLAGDVPAFSGVLVDLSERHKEDFGTRLNKGALFEHAKKLNTNIQTAYEDLFKTQYAEKFQKARDEELKAAEQRGRDAALRESRSALPHVVDAQEPSTLSGLKQAGEDPVRAAVKAAVEDAYAGKYRNAAET